MRQMQIGEPSEILLLVDRGYTDTILPELIQKASARQSALKTDLIASVEAAFGKDAAAALRAEAGLVHTGQPIEGGCDDPQCKFPRCPGSGGPN